MDENSRKEMSVNGRAYIESEQDLTHIVREYRIVQ
jgi:hypothetical protein